MKYFYDLKNVVLLKPAVLLKQVISINPLISIKPAVIIFILTCLTVSAQVKPIRVAFVGNSITQGPGTTDPKSFPLVAGSILGSHYQVKNYGIGGRTLLKKGDFPYWNETSFYDVQDFDPQILVISLGTNDSKPQNWKYKDEFFSDYTDMIRTFRKNGRHPQIYIARITPVFSVGTDINGTIIRENIIPLIDSVIKASKTYSIDFYNLMLDKSSLFQDGIHPNNEGYAIMGQYAADAIINSPSGITRYFNAYPPEFEKGQPSTLYWETTKGSKVTIDGKAVNETDSMVVNPDKTTKYTLINSGEASDTVYLTLNYLPPGKIKSFSSDFPFLDKGGKDSCLIKWTTTNGSIVTLNGAAVENNGSIKVSPTETTTYRLAAAGDQSDTSYLTVQVLEPEKINRAFSHVVKASSTARGYSPANVTDGDTSTSWVSASANVQQIYVDLGDVYDVSRVVLTWGDIFATVYNLQTMTASGAATKIYSEGSGNGGVDDITGLTGNGRYVKLFCSTRNMTDSGYVLKEFEVYGKKAVTGVNDKTALPSEYRLGNNYPNPFNPSTVITYELPEFSQVNIDVFDFLGRKAAALYSGQQNAGKYEVRFDGSQLSSGIYMVVMRAGEFSAVRKVMLLK